MRIRTLWTEFLAIRGILEPAAAAMAVTMMSDLGKARGPHR
ncbi:hypothetical protein ABZ826_33765 [Streptomyces sp. NPDC047515]